MSANKADKIAKFLGLFFYMYDIVGEDGKKAFKKTMETISKINSDNTMDKEEKAKAANRAMRRIKAYTHPDMFPAAAPNQFETHAIASMFLAMGDDIMLDVMRNPEFNTVISQAINNPEHRKSWINENKILWQAELNEKIEILHQAANAREDGELSREIAALKARDKFDDAAVLEKNLEARRNEARRKEEERMAQQQAEEERNQRQAREGLFDRAIADAISRKDPDAIVQAFQQDTIPQDIFNKYRQALYRACIQNNWVDAINAIIQKDDNWTGDLSDIFSKEEQREMITKEEYYEGIFAFLVENNGIQVNARFNHQLDQEWFKKLDFKPDPNIKGMTPLMLAFCSSYNLEGPIDYPTYRDKRPYLLLKGMNVESASQACKVKVGDEYLDYNALDFALLRETHGYSYDKYQQQIRNFNQKDAQGYPVYDIWWIESNRAITRQMESRIAYAEQINALIEKGVVPRQFEKYYAKYSVQSIIRLLVKHNFTIPGIKPENEKIILQDTIDRYVTRKREEREGPSELSYETYKGIYDKLGGKTYFEQNPTENNKKFVNEMMGACLREVKSNNKKKQSELRKDLEEFIKVYPEFISDVHVKYQYYSSGQFPGNEKQAVTNRRFENPYFHKDKNNPRQEGSILSVYLTSVLDPLVVRGREPEEIQAEMNMILDLIQKGASLTHGNDPKDYEPYENRSPLRLLRTYREIANETKPRDGALLKRVEQISKAMIDANYRDIPKTRWGAFTAGFNNSIRDIERGLNYLFAEVVRKSFLSKENKWYDDLLGGVLVAGSWIAGTVAAIVSPAYIALGTLAKTAKNLITGDCYDRKTENIIFKAGSSAYVFAPPLSNEEALLISAGMIENENRPKKEAEAKAKAEQAKSEAEALQKSKEKPDNQTALKAKLADTQEQLKSMDEKEKHDQQKSSAAAVSAVTAAFGSQPKTAMPAASSETPAVSSPDESAKEKAAKPKTPPHI